MIGLIRKNIVARMFLLILITFLLLFVCQMVILNNNIDTFFMRSYKSDMTAELKRTAGSFVTVAQSEDGVSTEYNHEASMEYVRRNELPLIIIDSQSKLIDNEIFNAYSILKVKNLRNEELYFIADFLSEYVDNPIDSISRTDILRIKGRRIGKSNYYQLTELRVGSKSYQDASIKDVRGMAEYITQFVYMDEFISPDISGEVILKKQLLFENLRPILISSSSPYTLLHNLEDSAIEDKFGNNYSILSYSTSDVLFITLLPVTRNNLFLGYLANYYVYLYAVFFIVIIVISYFFSRSLSAPLVHLSQVAERMAQLDFDVHANVNTPDQLGKLSDSLNVLSDNLQSSMFKLKKTNAELERRANEEKENANRMKILLEDMAHEFKTPLGIISGFTEIVEYGLLEKNREYYFAIIKDEINKLSELVNDTIDLSKLSSGYFAFDYANIDIAQFISEYLCRTDYDIKRNGFTVNTSLDHAIVCIDKKRITQVFDNLMSNIFKYTQGNKRIYISSNMSAPGEVTIRIKNPGVINDSDVTKVFDRYYICAMGSDYRVQSSGIGLEIVKRILTLHNSNYGVDLKDGQVCFYFTLYSELKLAKLQ